MQNAMREACRFATAGRIIQDSWPNGAAKYTTNLGVIMPVAISYPGTTNPASRDSCIRWWFLSNCPFVENTNNITITSQSVLPGAQPTLTTNNGVVYLSPSTNGPGAANDYVQIIATYNVNTITPLFSYLSGYNGGFSRGSTTSYLLRVSSIVKNEPALLNFEQTNMYPWETATN